MSESARPLAWGALTLLLVASSAWLAYMGGALVTRDAPNGIVSFELAGSSARAGEIIQSWSQQVQATALLIQGFDFLYLFVYPAWLSLSALQLATALGGLWGRSGLATSWAVLAAAPLDAVENYALVQQLLHGASSTHAELAWWCAVPKFTLVAAAAGYLLLAGGAWLARRRSA